MHFDSKLVDMYKSFWYDRAYHLKHESKQKSQEKI